MTARLVLDTEGFVNTAKVMAYADKKIIRFAVRYASYVMTVAKRSMRKPGKKDLPSPPGKPPRERYGQLEQFMIFCMAQNNDQYKVVIGPRQLGKSIDPGILEKGGRQLVTRTNRKTGETYSYWIEHPPRPYMQPAAAKAQERMETFWDQSVKRKR